MHIYLTDVRDVVLESPISEPELITMIDSWLRGASQSKILVQLEARKDFIDVKDVDIKRTLPGVLFTQ